MKESNEENTNGFVSRLEYEKLLAELEDTRCKLSTAEVKLASLQNFPQENTLVSGSIKLLLEVMPHAVQVWSKENVLIYANKAAANLFGFKTGQDFIDNFWVTMPEFQPCGGKSAKIGLNYIHEAKSSGFFKKNWVYNDVHGDDVPVELILIPNAVHSEEVLFVFLTDLREKKEFINKLHESDEYSKVMLDASPVGAMIWDSNLHPIDCNTSMAEAFGLKKERRAFMENLHKLYPEYQPDGMTSVQKIQEHLLEALKEGRSEGLWMGQTIHGEEVPTKATAVRAKHNGQDMVVVFYQDLRELEENIKKAQNAEKRSKAILNGVPLGINMLTPDLQIFDCNEEAIRITRFASREEFLSKTMVSFPEVQPNGIPSLLFLQEHLAQTTQNEKSRFELVAIDANDELYTLDVTLVLAHLEGEEIYIAYCFDLRETKQMLKDIELARENAEKSAHAKSEFLANMSHEIRTPMNGILGLLRILSGTDLDLKQKDYIQKALFSTNELLRIINDILDFSKIEAGKLEMEIIPFTIHDICSDMENLFMETIKGKKLQYYINEGEFPMQPILGDPLRLKQVFFNLINNAIKFTEKGSIDVEVSTVKQGNTLECQFKVTDTGIGLSAEQTEHLFTAFTQADTSVTRKYGGTGLGLAISKNIVKMMQGNIWVESTLGKGSSFFFTAYFELADTNSKQESTFGESIEEKKNCTEHILLVEDNQINQIIAEELLQSFGYTLDIANHGQEALDMLEKKPYDIVLMDIQMPIMDGLTTTRNIRKMPQFSSLPIVAMSAHAMTGDKEKSLKSGMNDHITKPISPEILYNTLRYWLEKKEATTSSL